MADDKQSRGQQDRIRVDINDPSEVEYLHSRYPDRSHEEIKRAIQQSGPFREDIEKALGGKSN